MALIKSYLGLVETECQQNVNAVFTQLWRRLIL
jgi:hypothetical protein